MPGTAPSFTDLARQALKGLPDNDQRPSESALQERIFDLRRHLVDHLLRQHVDSQEVSEAENLRRQDILRDALPPLSISPGPFSPVFSAWRSAIVAVLGLLLGSALGQGLLRVTDFSLGGGLVVLCGMVGVGLALWLAHSMLQALAAGQIRLPWGSFGIKKMRRFFLWGWPALLVLTFARDFLTGRETLTHILDSLGAFLTRGDTLALFNNMYGALTALGLFALCLKRPLHLDKDAFAERLELAARNWWAGAACAAQALNENAQLRSHDRIRQWRQVGADLFSLAGELPASKREWMEERLRRLGLEAPRQEGLLIWSQELSQRYESLGHMEMGDQCYVDEPPLLENGQLLRKGTVRKVRR